MRKILLTLIIFFSNISICLAQLSSDDSISRKKADDVLNKYFNEYLGKNRILVFSISDKFYFVIVEKQKQFEEYFLVDTGKINKVKIVRMIKKSNRLLKKAFNTNLYNKGFLTSTSNAKLQQGNLSYFVFKDLNGERYGEYRESIIIIPPPIDKDVYTYLVTRILKEN